MVTNIPTQPANAAGWRSTAEAPGCTRRRSASVTRESPSTAVSPSSPSSSPVSAPWPGSGRESASPTASTGRATTNPAIGPATPTSNSWRRSERHRNEVRRGDVEVVAPGGEIVTELVAQQHREQREREHESRRPGPRGVRRQRIGAREQVERVVVGDRPREHGAGKRGGEQGGEEESGMQRPPRAPPRERPREHQVPAAGFVRPVIAPGPARERRGERRGGAGVGRMYKRVNHFPVGEDGGPPGEEEIGEVHRRS